MYLEKVLFLPFVPSGALFFGGNDYTDLEFDKSTQNVSKSF